MEPVVQEFLHEVRKSLEKEEALTADLVAQLGPIEEEEAAAPFTQDMTVHRMQVALWHAFQLVHWHLAPTEAAVANPGHLKFPVNCIKELKRLEDFILVRGTEYEILLAPGDPRARDQKKFLQVKENLPLLQGLVQHLADWNTEGFGSLFFRFLESIQFPRDKWLMLIDSLRKKAVP